MKSVSIAFKKFKTLLVLVILMLIIGVLFYHFFESMSFVDALYFSVITLTTVGYGDIVPHTSLGKLFTVAYIFVGLGLIFAFINKLTQTELREIAARNVKKELIKNELKPIKLKKNN